MEPHLARRESSFTAVTGHTTVFAVICQLRHRQSHELTHHHGTIRWRKVECIRRVAITITLFGLNLGGMAPRHARLQQTRVRTVVREAHQPERLTQLTAWRLALESQRSLTPFVCPSGDSHWHLVTRTVTKGTDKRTQSRLATAPSTPPTDRSGQWTPRRALLDAASDRSDHEGLGDA